MFLILTSMNCSSLNNDYIQLHHNAVVVDMHCDTVLDLINGDDIAARDSLAHLDLPKMKTGGIDLQVFACFVWTETTPEEAYEKVNLMIDTLETQIAENSEKIELCYTADQAKQIIAQDKIAAFLAIENGVALGGDLARLNHFYNRGIRYLTLTHIASNDLGTSSSDTLRPGEGLTEFGKLVTKRMNELGMIIDISHARSATVDDVLKITVDPIIASHSCAMKFCNHDRNLTDEQIKKIAKNGGVIGINYFVYYLSQRAKDISDSIDAVYKDDFAAARAKYPDDHKKRRELLAHVYAAKDKALENVNVDIGTIVDHIDHIVKLVGPNHVGLGSDFDGVSRLPEGLQDCSMVPNITKELVNRGYSKEDIKKILGGNFLRVFKQVCG